MVRPLLFQLFFLFCCLAQAQETRHVILISVDGFRPEFYINKRWHAPTLQRLMYEGIYAEALKPVFPSVTVPNHVSMITGALPDKHGIYYNQPFQRTKRTTTWSYSMIGRPTIFDAAHHAGLTSCALYWPVTKGSSIHYNIFKSVVLGKRTSALAYPYTTPQGLWPELQSQLYSNNMAMADKNIGKMTAYIFETYKPSLLAVHFTGLDKAQHKSGTNSKLVELALEDIDQSISLILEAIKKSSLTENTTVLIVGDHGFCDVHSAMAPNVWLKTHRVLGNGKNWKARFHTANGSAFLYVRDQNDVKVVERVRHVLEKTPQYRKGLFRIMEKDELAQVGADPDAVLALIPLPGIAIVGTSKGKSFKRATGGAHGYLNDFGSMMSGFIGWGRGLQSGVINEMSVQDIAPIIAALLELDFESIDGVIPDILKF